MCVNCERLEARIRQQEETVVQLIEMVAMMNGNMKNLLEQKERMPGTR